MSILRHGNYCGGDWSEGKVQDSVCGTLPPTDSFDATCQTHDCCLYNAKDNLDLQTECNRAFYNSNINQGLKRSAAANIVYYGHRPYRYMSDLYAPSNKRARVNSFPTSSSSDLFYGDPSGYQSDYADYNYGPNLARTTPNMKRQSPLDIPLRPTKAAKNLFGDPRSLNTVKRNLLPYFNLVETPTQKRRRWFSKLPRRIRRSIARRKQTQFRSSFNRSRALRLLRLRRKVRNRAAGLITRSLYYGTYYKKKYGSYFNPRHIRRNFNTWRQNVARRAFRRDYSHLFQL